MIVAVKAVRVRGLVKRFGDKVAVNRVSFDVEVGEVYGLLGPNGAGKSTLISMIAGIIEPDEGSIKILGGSNRSVETKLKFNYCPQNPALYEELTGLENLIFYSNLYGITGKAAKEKAKSLIRRVGLEEYANKPVKAYSGGMKKRLNLAAALINDPELLILDEPTTGMDPNIRRDVWRLLNEVRDSNRTIIISTHYMEEAEALSDRVAIMDYGRIIAEGRPEDLKEKYVPEVVINVELAESESPHKASEALRDRLNLKDIVAEEGSLRIYAENSDVTLSSVAFELFRAGVKITSLRVSKPNLEDVFLKLTGRRIGEG